MGTFLAECLLKLVELDTPPFSFHKSQLIKSSAKCNRDIAIYLRIWLYRNIAKSASAKLWNSVKGNGGIRPPTFCICRYAKCGGRSFFETYSSAECVDKRCRRQGYSLPVFCELLPMQSVRIRKKFRRKGVHFE
jgi:hypothetical protein